MFFPTIADFFLQRKQRVFSHTRILLFLDIDGVVRLRKGPVPQEIVSRLNTLSREYNVQVVLITGAPAHHLPPELLRPNIPLFRAFAESGAVERLHNGLLLPHKEIVKEFRQLESYLGLEIDDGLVHIASLNKSIIREGRRLTGFTAIIGKHYPPQSQSRPTATHEDARSWIKDIINSHHLPFILLEGYEQTYSYIDVVHRDVGKAWRVESILRKIRHGIALYIGDGSGDEEAMALPGIIPIALQNSTSKIKSVSKFHGFSVQKHGPDGTYEFLTAFETFLRELH